MILYHFYAHYHGSRGCDRYIDGAITMDNPITTIENYAVLKNKIAAEANVEIDLCLWFH